MRTIAFLFATVIAATALPAAAGVVVIDADHVQFTAAGTIGGVPVSASANVYSSDDSLTIILKNTSTDPTNAFTDSTANTLTGVFFDFGDNTLPLSAQSAAVASGGALYNASSCNPGPCTAATTDVSGEFGFKMNLAGGSVGYYGLSSARYAGVYDFESAIGGSNLDNPTNVDGINFGIIQATGFNPNGSVDSDPMIQDAVTFVLTGVAGHHAREVGRLSFLYGTAPSNVFTEFGVAFANALPEPGAMFMIGLAAFMAVPRRTARR